MHEPRKAVGSFLLYVAAVIATTLIWFGVMDFRATQYADWTGPCQNANRTLSQCARHDPYCVVDPACMSPFYKPTYTRRGITPQFMPHWQGLYWLGEAGTYGTGPNMLAIPNYALFMLLLCITVVVVEWRTSRPGIRRILVTGVTTWLVLEVLRWFTVISSVDPTVPFFNWELITVLSLSLLILWSTIIVSNRLARPKGSIADRTAGNDAAT